MQVFRPNNITHQLLFIPRFGVENVLLEITNELRGNVDILPINGTVFNNVFFGNFNYTFKEGASYDLIVKDYDNRLLFRGKAYATDVEDLQNYKLIR